MFALHYSVDSLRSGEAAEKVIRGMRLHNGNIDNPKLTITVGPSVWFSSARIKYGSAVLATNTNFSHYTREYGNEPS